MPAAPLAVARSKRERAEIGRRFTDLTDPEFTGLLVGFRSSAFRLETLQTYVVEYEAASVAAYQYLQGEPAPSDLSAAELTALIHGHVSAGRKFGRVHVLVEPLSPYMRFELTRGYAAGVAGGERIRVVPTEGWSETWLPREDFWLFDEVVVVHMYYDEDGRFVGGEIDTDDVVVTERVRRMLVAQNASIPLSDYLLAHPELAE